MTTAHDIDMKEVRIVCDRAVVDYAATAALGDEGTQQLLNRIGRLLAAASAVGWLHAIDGEHPDQDNVKAASPDEHEREATGWGARLIAGRVGVCHSTVHAVLTRAGVSRIPPAAREGGEAV